MFPPFKENGMQMRAEEVAKNRHIANRRIIVENAIERMKNYDVLHKKLPIKFAESIIISDIVKVVAICRNFGPPLR